MDELLPGSMIRFIGDFRCPDVQIFTLAPGQRKHHTHDENRVGPMINGDTFITLSVEDRSENGYHVTAYLLKNPTADDPTQIVEFTLTGKEPIELIEEVDSDT